MAGTRLVLTVELERERRDRWIAEVVTIPGVMVYGKSRLDAFRKVQSLAFEVIADRVKHGENPLTGRKLARLGPPVRSVEFERASQGALAGH